MAGREKTVAVMGLLTGAFVWGLIWYPYRVLAAAGLPGALSTTITYLVALLLGLALWRDALRRLRPSWLLVAIGLTAGGCNFGYVLATLHGEVMRVLLLFYLAPLWTVLLARLVLHERISVSGGGVVLLSVAGAATMLWQPRLGAPLPANGAEWIGLASGFLFALSNVLVRKAEEHSIEMKSLAVFAGVLVIGTAIAPFDPAGGVRIPLDGNIALLVLIVGVVLLLVNIVVQHGLMGVPANRAIVILLSELVVAALSSWFLAGERMSAREWLGGAMIVLASLLSGIIEGGRAPTPPTAVDRPGEAL